jgi:serine/threonine-protein kinase
VGDPTQGGDADEEPVDYGPIQPGAIVAGKYRVDRVVGLGGMGQVVAATHVDLGQEVAIKILLSDRANDAEAVERFLREAHAAVRLKSTHVARVFDVGTTAEGLPYIVMELLDGLDLCSVLERDGHVPVADAVDFILQACDAVAEAHARGIVHRDLKPENLFLTTRRDGSPCIKVLDFGISKVGGAQAMRKGRRALTQDDVVMGSPAYMSPEQVKSSKKADARSDIWSLGVTLYEMLTGREPFSGESAPDIFVAILTTEPKPPDAITAGLPAGLSDVVMRCLAKDAETRFQNVEELAAALLPFATRRPTSVAPSWTNTSPEFRVPGAPPSSQRIPRSNPQAATLDGTPPSGDFPVPPSGGFAVPPGQLRLQTPASPAGVSSTIMERRVAKSRSIAPYAIAGVVAALVVALGTAGVMYKRSASAAANAPPPEGVPQPSLAEPTPSAEPAPTPTATASVAVATTAAPTTTASSKPAPTGKAAPKAAGGPAPATAAPKGSALPRYRTTW